jgi:hypothetical protein
MLPEKNARKKPMNELGAMMCGNRKGMRRVETFSNRFPSDVPHFQSRLLGSAAFTGFSAVLRYRLSAVRGSVPDAKPPLMTKPTQQA